MSGQVAVTLRGWQLHGAAEPSPIRVVMVWDSRAPWEVQAVLRRDVEWALSRGLLIDGLTHHAGIGDVRVAPGGHGEVHLTLTGHLPDGTEKTAVLALPAAALHGFLARTLRVVPRDVWPCFDDAADAEIREWIASKERN